MLSWVLVAVVLILLVALVLLVLPCYLCGLRTRVLLNRLPGPRGYPFFGSMLELMVPHEDLLQTLSEKYHRNPGPLFKMWFLGAPFAFIKSLDYIETVMSSRQYIAKGLEYDMLKPWLRQGLLTSTGSKWHARRKALTPAFHFKILEDNVPVITKNSAVLVDTLRRRLHEPWVDVNQLVTLCTLDIICETAMGTSVNAQNGGQAEYVNAIKRMGNLFQHRQLSIWLHRNFLFYLSPTGYEQRKVLGILHGFTRKVIEERRAEWHEDQGPRRGKKLAFLDLLIDISKSGGELNDLDIQEEVDTFMFEGHDTTSAAISWALHLLGMHPDIQERAARELDEIFGASERPANQADLVRMRYLEQVIKETLRLYPSVPFISRLLDTDLRVGKYLIPAGVNLPISPYMIHRDPELYPEPLKFDPDRFLPENVHGRHPYAYIPFSAGPRNCIGQRFALMEEKVVLSSVLRNFRLESLDRPEDIKTLMELVLKPMKGLRIKFTPRH